MNQANLATVAQQQLPRPPATSSVGVGPGQLVVMHNARTKTCPQPPTVSTKTVATLAPHAPGTLSGFLYDWQGLEGGGLAIAAAVLGAVVLNHQTRQNNRHKNDEDARRLRAARTAMPLTLSSLSEYADQSAAYLAHHYSIRSVHGAGTPAPVELPVIPAEAIPALERLVEAGSEQLSACVSDLLGDLQIFASRVRGLMRSDPTRPLRPLAKADARTYVIDIGVVAARISSLYDYGRRKSEAVPPTPSWDDVWTALKLMGFDEDLDPDLHATVTARKSRRARVGHMDTDDTLRG